MGKIPFNKPFLSGNELRYIEEAVRSGKISGDGTFTRKCHQFFEGRYGFKKVLLTNSCTDALEMAAILIDIQPEDEVILPSYTFVSTANAFVLRGAKIVFADSCSINPNIDVDKIEPLINSKTKAIAVVHYAGIACDMDKLISLADKHNLFVVEDAAQSIDSFYWGQPLGSIGHLAAFSFHESKNIISGEGGMLVINDERFIKRAEIIWEKGTNRSAFWRGEVDKYNWMDIGSSFLPSEVVAAYLFAQLENLDKIQSKRKKDWELYSKLLRPIAEEGLFMLPIIPEFATNNAHMFYLLCQSENERNELIEFLKMHGILSVFHYILLHKSPFYNTRYNGPELINANRYSKQLLRLPMFYALSESDIKFICKTVKEFYS